MVVRNPLRLAAAAGLLAASAAFADPVVNNPAVPAAAASAADQTLADQIANKLANTSGLSGYQVSIACRSGEIVLTGTCVDDAQHNEIIGVVRRMSGVKIVRDRMAIGGSAVRQIQAEAPPMGLPNLPGGPYGGGMPGGMQAPQGGPPMMSSPMPGGTPMTGGPAGPHCDPSPINAPPSGGVYDLNPPRLPPYAWPTYAPYNNFSRVGYPTEYPYNAYPFIGPFYPFPKVPPGYRSIKLEWEDGHWWYGRFATKRDYWSVRYW